MQFEQEKRRNKHLHSQLMRIHKIGVIACAVCVIGLLNFLIPFRSLLPAWRIKARAEGETAIHFLSVGQADCSVLECADGELFIIDGGDGSWSLRNKLLGYLKGIGASCAPKITYIVTHADGDHYGGVAELIENFGGDSLYLPTVGSKHSDYLRLINVASERGVAMRTLSRYHVLPFTGGYMSCIAPLSSTESGEANELSSVLYLKLASFSALFCGDISSNREGELLEEYQTDQTFFDVGEYAVRLENISLLKVAHHGSATASSLEWLKLLKPSIAVISCGQGNAYSHPSFQTVARLKEANESCNVYRTDELEDIVVRLNGEKLSVEYGIME